VSLFDRSELVAAAEVDPWALVAQLSAGDPDQIDELAAAFYRAAGDTKDASASDARAKQFARAGYRVDGGAPVDYSAEAHRTSTSLSGAAEKLPRIAAVLSSVAEDLASATQSARAEVHGLESELSSIEQQYYTFMQGTGHHLPPDDQAAVRADYLRNAIAKVQSYGGATTGVVMDYEHALARATKSLADLGYVAPLELREAGEQVTDPLPVGADPKRVAAWWAGLTPAQQEYLIDHDYQTLGQLRGLPATVLDTTNRHRIADDRAGLQKQLAALAADPSLDPLGLQRQALQSRLADDNGILDEIDKAGPGQPPSQIFVLAYDPNGKEGQTGVVISYGNPDTADNTGVVVPGTTNNASKLGGVGADGRALYNTMTGSSKAVVVWLDGPEPQSIVPDAASDSWANESAPNLVSDIAGLRAAHTAASGDPGHLTVIGHSYGSYIVGKAMTQGAAADDVVFVGSPGVGVDHAGDLGIDPSHVWDGEAGDDPILWTEKRFTPDPLTGNNPEDSDFGAQHFSVDGSHGHSEYYKNNSESLHNMANIVEGDYASVDTVPAPNYRGIKELPGDLISTGLTPIDTTLDTAGDLVTGHPVNAAKDVWNGTVREGENVINVGEDGVDTVESGAKWVWDHL
jgi:hypothetical protein